MSQSFKAPFKVNVPNMADRHLHIDVRHLGVSDCFLPCCSCEDFLHKNLVAHAEKIKRLKKAAVYSLGAIFQILAYMDPLTIKVSVPNRRYTNRHTKLHTLAAFLLQLYTIIKVSSLYSFLHVIVYMIFDSSQSSHYVSYHSRYY